MLLSGIARMTQHAGQFRLLLTLTHESENKIKSMIVNIRAGLDAILLNTPQLPKAGRWPALVRYIISKIIASKPQNSQLLKSFPFALAYDSG
jgi:hypothetical protein